MVPSFGMTSFGGRRVCVIRFIYLAFPSQVILRCLCVVFLGLEEGLVVVQLHYFRYDLLRYVAITVPFLLGGSFSDRSGLLRVKGRRKWRVVSCFSTVLMVFDTGRLKASAWSFGHVEEKQDGDGFIELSGSGTLPGNTVTNPKEDLKGITTRSGVTIQGPKAFNHDTEVTKDTMPPANNGSTKDVQPPVVQIQTRNPNPEPNVAPVVTPVPKASIPFPSRRNDERRKEKASENFKD
ncbi:hypothetical protein Tco_1578387 [Tanacetum coccineum]